MSKSNLNELCQKAGWETPKYSCTKKGQDHSPLFQGSVELNGSSFHSSALFPTSNAAKNDVAAIAFSHCATFSLPIAEMKNLKKQKLTDMGSCSNKDKGEERTMEITPPDVAVPATNEPDVVLPKGSVVLPIAEGKWTIVSLE